MKTKKILIVALSLILIFVFSASAIAAGAPGKIAFVGFNADGLDGFSFVLLTGTHSGSVINFTDNEWNGTQFVDSNEGILTWTAPVAPLPAGTVVTIEAGAVVGAGKGSITGSSGSLNLGGTNEMLYAYQGDFSNPTVFLAAISNEAFSATVGLLTNTGLTEGTTAVNIDGDEDVAVYTGSTTFANEAAALTAIGNIANWTTQDGSGDQSQDATTPDFPDDVAAAFVITSPTPITLASFAGRTVNNLPVWASLFAIVLLGGAFALRRKNA